MKNKIIGIILTFIFTLVFAGCATWEGVKKDTSDGWEATKDVVHEATE
jgi:predicted small secreted protein